jgi:predicted  nucleic acid-binding Zn-ribbon protein
MMADDKPAGSGAGKTRTASGTGGRKSNARPKAVKPPTLNLKAEERNATASQTAKTSAGPGNEKSSKAGQVASAPKLASASASASASEQNSPAGAKRAHQQPPNGQSTDPKPTPGLGLIGYLVAGVTGAATAALVSVGMGAVGLNDPAISALQTQVDAVAEQVGQTQALQDQIATLEARQNELTEQLTAGSQPDSQADDGTLNALQTALESSISDMQSRFDSLSERIDILSDRASSDAAAETDIQPLRTALDAFGERLATAEARFDQVATGEELTALQTALAEASGEDADGATGLAGLAELGQSLSGQNDAMARRLDDLEPRIEGLASSVTAFETRLGETLGTGASMSDIEAMGDRIATVNREFGELQEGLATLQARADATEQMLIDLGGRIDETQSSVGVLQQHMGAMQDGASSGSSDTASRRSGRGWADRCRSARRALCRCAFDLERAHR